MTSSALRRLSARSFGLLLLIGCGGSGTATTTVALDQALVEELAEAMNIVPPEDVPADLFGPAEARCWAEATVTALGNDAVRAAGFGQGEPRTDEEIDAALESLTSSFTEEVAVVYIGYANTCLDFASFLASDMVREGLPQDTALCVANRMVERDDFVEWLAGTMFGDGSSEPPGDDEMMATVTLAMVECA